jgi:hypothetical protein
MKNTIKMIAVASVAMLSAAVFAGNAPSKGGGGQGTGGTTTQAAIATAVAAVVGTSAGVLVAKSTSGALTISPASGGAGGVTFAPVSITVAGASFTVSANGGIITVIPVSE